MTDIEFALLKKYFIMPIYDKRDNNGHFNAYDIV